MPAVLIVEHFTIFFIVNLQLNALISILKLNRLVNIWLLLWWTFYNWTHWCIFIGESLMNISQLNSLMNILQLNTFLFFLQSSRFSLNIFRITVAGKWSDDLSCDQGVSCPPPLHPLYRLRNYNSFSSVYLIIQISQTDLNITQATPSVSSEGGVQGVGLICRGS